MRALKNLPTSDALYHVVDINDYSKNPQLYEDSVLAITVPESQYVLPAISKNEYNNGAPGICLGSFISQYNEPNNNEYLKDNIIDLSDSNSYSELNSKCQTLRNLEAELLVNTDSVTNIKTDPNDSPVMAGLKKAINLKHCDLNAYAGRFNGNFANDKRILAENDITLLKLKKYANALDMELTLSISDKDGDIVNPMNDTITIKVNGGSDNE